MKTYCLFIYGTFDDHEDVEYFCNEVLSELKTVKKIRYAIESSKNVIVVFESDSEHSEISMDVLDIMISEDVKFYFIYPLNTMISAHIPEELKDFIFNPDTENLSLRIEYDKKPKKFFNLDDVLDKIEKEGLKSLTEEEKKFLDNF